MRHWLSIDLQTVKPESIEIKGTENGCPGVTVKITEEVWIHFYVDELADAEVLAATLKATCNWPTARAKESKL